MSKLIVRQGNDLIEASYKIASLGEARLVRLLIGQISSHDEDFKTYHISVSDFAHVFGLDSKDGRLYEMLYKAADELTSRKIRIRNGESWLLMNWLSSAEYKAGSGYVELCFDKKLKPYLLDLKSYYTEYDLEHTVHFKSLYSVRLFELIQKEAFKANAKGYFKRSFEYEEFREKMGIEKDEYKLFAHFRTRVIESAQKEISKFSSLNIFQVDYAKTGRKITHIVFHVEKQKQGFITLEGGSPILKEQPAELQENPEDVRELVSMGIDEKTAYKWRKKYGAKRLISNIAYARAMQKAGKIKESLAGFVATSIANNLAGGWEKEAQKKEEQRKKQEQIEKEKLNIEERERIASKQKTQNLLDSFHALDESEQEAIRYLFEKQTSDFVLKRWKAEKEKNQTPEKNVKFSAEFIRFYETYQANLKLPV